jgi:uncharacterized membrane protein YfcA
VLGGAVGVILGTLRMPALIPLGRDGRAPRGGGRISSSASSSASQGFATHAFESGIDWWILGVGLAGAIPGGWFGARATGRFSENSLRLALGVVLVVVGIAFAIEAVVA